MKLLLQQHRFFFVLFACWLLLGGILLSQINTGDVLMWLNGRRSPFWDKYCSYGTQLSEEKAYLLMIFLLLFYRIRDAGLLLLTGLIVLITSGLAKAYFLHDRPYVYLTIEGLMTQVKPIEGIKLLVGKTSFPSGHSTGAFALFGLLTFILPRKFRLGWFFFICALTVAISRMYLIQHFFKDVYAGSILGLALAIVIYLLQLRIPDDKTRWWNRSILKLRENPPIIAKKDQ